MAYQSPWAQLGYSAARNAARRSSRPRQTRPEPEPIQPEETRSILQRGVGALVGLGNVLDLPVSMVRDTLAGENPFDQWRTPTRSDNRVQMNELMKDYGLAFDDRTKAGRWGNFATSFAADVALDPLTWISGPLGTLAKGAKFGSPTARSLKIAAKTADEAGDVARAQKLYSKAAQVGGETVEQAMESAKGLGTLDEAVDYARKTTLKEGSRPTEYLPTTPAAIADQIRAGERGVIGIRNPLTGTQYASFGVGSERAAKGIEKAFYGPLKGPMKALSAPTRGLRYLFSPTAGYRPGTGKAAITGTYQKVGDLRAAQEEGLIAGMQNVFSKFMRVKDDLYKEFDDIAKYHKVHGDEKAFNRVMLDALEFKGGLSDPAVMRAKLAETLGVPEEAIGERGLDWATTALDNFTKLHLLKDETYKRARKLGMKGSDLDDIFAQHLGRQPTEMARYGPKYRKDIFRDYPGKTLGLIRLTSDRLLVGMDDMKRFVKHAKTDEEKALAKMYNDNIKTMRDWIRDHVGGPLDEATEKAMKKPSWVMDKYVELRYLKPDLDNVIEEYGGKLARDSGKEFTREDILKLWLEETKKTRKGKEVTLPSRLSQLRQYTNKLDREFVNHGVFHDNYADAFHSYMTSYLRKEATLRGLHHALLDPGILKTQKEAGDVLFAKAWADAGFTAEGRETLFSSAMEKGLPIGDMKQAAKEVWVNPEVAGTIHAYRFALNDESLKEFSDIARRWDKVLSLYRGALIARPAFNVRNAGSGIFQEATEGKVPFTSLMKGHWEAMKYLMNPSKHQLEYADEIKEFLMKEGMTQVDDVSASIAKTMHQVPKGGWREIFEQPFKGSFSKGAWKERWNPLRARGVFDKPAGLAPDSKEDLFHLFNLSENMYNATEFMLRGGYYTALRKAGYEAGEAAHLVTRAHFDYSKVSHFHNKAVRRAFLFATWKRKSIPYTLQKVLERPGGRTAQSIRLLTHAQRQQDSGGVYIPSFLRTRTSVPIPGEDPREQSFLTQSGVPIEDLNTLVLGSNLREGIQETGMQMLAETNPLAVYGLESILRKQLYTGRPLEYLDSRTERWTGQRVPWLDRIIAASPYSAMISAGEKPFDTRKNIGMRGANFLTGLKFSTYDTEKWKALDAIEQLTDELRQSPYVRTKEIDYVPRDYKDKLSPEMAQKMERRKDLEKIRNKLAEEERERKKKRK